MKEIKSGIKFLFVIAVKELYDINVKFCHSLDIGMRGMFLGDKTFTLNDIKKIDLKIKEYINGDFPILKINVSRKDAINYYDRYKEYEKSESIKNLINETVIFNELLGYYNYFFSDIVNTTKEIGDFKIVYLGNNDFVLIDNYSESREYNHKVNIFNEFNHYNSWMNHQGIHYVSDLNRIISDNKIEDFIKKNDIMIDNEIMNVAEDIIRLKKKIVFLGGPSSSGKTTSTRKLGLYLNALGKNAIKLSLDDYYKELDEIKPDKSGKRDFESINSIDLKLFKENMTSLLSGESVVIPKYHFVSASKYFDSDPIKIGKDDIILVEGLHSLNDLVSENIAKKQKYKVYVSPFTPLTLDRHNYISTTDNRLMRRIVRDNRTRGASVEKTLASWKDVRIGEEKNIFPFTNEADVVLNTAYIYELNVLRVYVEPLLYTVNMDSPYYSEARRLLESLKIFFPISSECIKSDNVLREFIGKSEFNEG